MSFTNYKRFDSVSTESLEIKIKELNSKIALLEDEELMLRKQRQDITLQLFNRKLAEKGLEPLENTYSGRLDWLSYRSNMETLK